MDRLESLGQSLSQITMYDIKSMYEQAKNVVLNVSESEAKVREATNDEPWGASSTLMQDIANRTFNYAEFNEVMPAIYSRFMEKEARQWRQIYKSLQLLEYLVKHGSERVVDDARSHISTIKMLRSFHYIDDNGKDQGINVRNRAKELVELLADVEKIRTERRKAKANKHKYVGTGNDAGYYGESSGGFSSGGSRYGGFGSESFNDHYSGGGYSGSSFSGGGGSSGGFRDSTNRGGFEEYDAGGDDLTSSPTATSPRRSGSARKTEARMSSSQRKAEAPKPEPKQPEVDLLGGFDDPVPAANTTAAPPAAASGLLDDEFADFQEAPSSPTTASSATMTSTAPTAIAAPSNPNAALMGLFNAQPLQATSSTTSPPPSMGMGMSGAPQHQQQRSLSGGMGMASMSGGIGMGMMQPTQSTTVPKPSVGAGAPASKTKTANFDDLWAMGISSSSSSSNKSGGQKTMMEMQKEKANAGLWGGGGAQPKGFNAAMLGNMGNMSGGGTGGDSLI